MTLLCKQYGHDEDGDDNDSEDDWTQGPLEMCNGSNPARSCFYTTCFFPLCASHNLFLPPRPQQHWNTRVSLVPLVRLFSTVRRVVCHRAGHFVHQPSKYTNTNIQIQTHKYKYTNTVCHRIGHFVRLNLFLPPLCVPHCAPHQPIMMLMLTNMLI